MTISERIEATGGRSSGFDYMRITLAALIVCWHSIVTSYGAAVQDAANSGLARPFIASMLPIFFTLSGFLVAGSLERCRTVGMFLGLRAIRIFPALVVESLVFALIVGPLLTTLPLADYLGSPVFHRYFLNVLGLPQYHLPGLFEQNPIYKVNGQLWTVPFELECYIALAALAAIGVVRKRSVVLWGTAAFFAVRLPMNAIRYPGEFWSTSSTVPGWMLVFSFLLGVAIYLYRERLPWSWAWCAACLLGGLTLLALPLGQYFAAFPLAYATVFLGLCNPRKIGVLRGADYSYGVFLYGFPVQQTFMSFGPWTHHWWLNILVCLPAATVLAALSWHLVEKPASRLRKPLKQIEDRWLRARRTLAAIPAE